MWSEWRNFDWRNDRLLMGDQVRIYGIHGVWEVKMRRGVRDIIMEHGFLVHVDRDFVKNLKERLGHDWTKYREVYVKDVSGMYSGRGMWIGVDRVRDFRRRGLLKES